MKASNEQELKQVSYCVRFAIIQKKSVCKPFNWLSVLREPMLLDSISQRMKQAFPLRHISRHLTMPMKKISVVPRMQGKQKDLKACGKPWSIFIPPGSVMVHEVPKTKSYSSF